MASPKSKPVDTATTNPAEFLTGQTPPPAETAAPAPPTTTAVVPPPNPVADPPGRMESVVSVPTPPAQSPASQVEPPANRPGLEIQSGQAQPSGPPDPFTLLAAFQTGQTYRNLSALVVPGGCIVRSTSVRGSNFADSICFVPGVVVLDGRLASLHEVPPSVDPKAA